MNSGKHLYIKAIPVLCMFASCAAADLIIEGVNTGVGEVVANGTFRITGSGSVYLVGHWLHNAEAVVWSNSEPEMELDVTGPAIVLSNAQSSDGTSIVGGTLQPTFIDLTGFFYMIGEPAHSDLQISGAGSITLPQTLDTSPITASSVVPEPSVFSMVLVGLLALHLRSRHADDRHAVAPHLP